MSGAIDVSGVEEGHSELDAPSDGPARLVVVDTGVTQRLAAPRHRTADGPAAEPQRTHLKA